MNQTEYWDEIRDLAKEFNTRVNRGPDYDEQDPGEWLWETLDGHEFVIYTVYAREVLQISPNDQAYSDQTGEVVDFHRPELGALYAMQQDVVDAL